MRTPPNPRARPTLGTAFFLALILVLLFVGASSYRFLDISSDSDKLVVHTHEVLARIQDLRIEMRNIASSQHAFFKTDGGPSRIIYRDSVARADRDVTDIRRLTADNASQQRLVSDLAGLVERNRRYGESVLGLQRPEGFPAAADAARGDESQQTLQGIQDRLNDLSGEELRLLGTRATNTNQSLMRTRSVLLLGIGLCVFVAAAAAWIMRRDNRWRAIAEAALFEEKEQAEETLNSIGDAVIRSDIAGNITFLNSAATRMTVRRKVEALGRPFIEIFRIVNATSRDPSPSPIDAAIDQNKVSHLSPNSVLIRQDGADTAVEDSAAPIHDKRGRVTGAVMVLRDVSAAPTLSQRTQYLAQHDAVTNLPNRFFLTDRLNQSISLARRRNTKLAVLFLDLDRFKQVNESFGHAVGDRLLQSVAQCLLNCVRDPDTVSRQRGDEFIVLLSEVERGQDAAVAADKILLALSEPHHIDAHELHITTSIGIATYPDDGVDAQTLIRNADFAMYHAKSGGRNNYQFFNADLNAIAIERQFLEDSLHHALERQEFFLHYQPKIALETGAVMGIEALIRWHHPQRGSVAAAQFVPIAEECGLIVPIGRWVLREACTQARVWQQAGLLSMRIAVNISTVELRAKDFVTSVRATLAETGLAPDLLELELTETYLMQDSSATGEALVALKELGVGLALDDFGTGYSSLSYLKRFPINTVKIDQSFVRDLTTDVGDASIVSAVIGMGKGLNMRVVAEGVETAEQLAFLKERDCPEGQGYYFSRPVAAGELTKFLTRQLAESAHV